MLLLVLIFAFTVPGVFAYWSYVHGLPNQESGLGVTLLPFVYKPEEVLPQDPEQAENHLAIIQSILTEPNGGLNSTQGHKSLFIPENLRSCGGVLYCRQKVTGGNLIKLFTPETAANVYFVLEAVSNTEIAAYTMSKPEIDSSGVGDAVVVYRTLIRKNGGTWTAEEAVAGHVRLKMVSAGGVTILSFDPRQGEWKKGLTLET